MRPTGITLAAGAGAVVATALAAAAVIGPDEPAVRLAAMAGCVTASGALGGDLVAALGTAGIAWSVLNGFLVNRLGELTWHGPADAIRLAVLGGAAMAGWMAGWLTGWPAATAARALRHRRELAQMRAWLHSDAFAPSIQANPSSVRANPSSVRANPSSVRANTSSVRANPSSVQTYKEASPSG